MTINHRTGITVWRGKGESTIPLPVLWNERWQSLPGAREVMSHVGALWRHANRHDRAGIDRATGKPPDWETKLGLRNELRDVADALQSATKARAAAGNLGIYADAERKALKPYRTGIADTGAFAITCASARAALLALTADERRKFVKDARSELERRAVFELGRPEFLGLPSDDATYWQAYADAVQSESGPRIGELDALAELATYAQALAAGVEQQAKADGESAGVPPQELANALKALGPRPMATPP